MPETIQSQVQAGTIHWRRSLRTHVALWSGALAAVVLLLIFVAAALLLRERIVDDAQRDTRASTREAAERLDGNLGTVRSEEHTSELQSLMRISYAALCLKKRN